MSKGQSPWNFGRVTEWLVEPRISREQCERWIEALRSGDFSQGKGKLWSGDWELDEISPETSCMCCIGVYCYLEQGDLTRNAATCYIESGKVVRKVGLALDPSLLWLGRVRFSGVVFGADARSVGDVEDILAACNDAGESFASIAEWLERELLPRAKPEAGEAHG